MWLKEGDKNLKFFHTCLMMKRRRNKILAIKDDRRWIEDRRGIGDYFKRKFLELYKSYYPHIPEEVDSVGCKCISDQENREIIRIP